VKLTFLGTSAGKPTRERNVSALSVEFDQDNKWYLFDCGEATQHQLLRTRPSVGKLAAIFITHLHGDHIFGLPGLLSSKRLDGALRPLTIYGPEGIGKFLACIIDLSYDYLGYELEIVEFKAGETFVFDRFRVTVLPLVHSIESFAFHLKENDISNRLDEAKLRADGLEPSPLYGELKAGRSVTCEGRVYEPEAYLRDPLVGRTLIIAGDNAEPGVLGSALEGVDLLVHECTYTQEVYDALGKKLLHTTARDLGRAAQAGGVKNVIATHISPRYGPHGTHSVEAIRDEIREQYAGGVFIAEDFDVYTLARQGIVKKV
jgi:ribonuclease Z